MQAAPLPFAGIRVLDVASFIAAPVAATVFADYGADVIKVEPPGQGDPNRQTWELASYPKAGLNYPWELDSRGKRSIALDLRREAAREVLYRLVSQADVLITNYPQPVRERLGLSYEAIRTINPRMIYAALSGYGEVGPDKDLLGFDVTAFFARSGLLDSNRYEGQAPGVVMPAQGDRSSGISLFAGILIALWMREKSGEGGFVSSSLLANGLWANGVGAQAALLGGFLPPRPPRERPRNALTNAYQTADERWVQLSIVREERDWPVFCRLIDRLDWLSDPGFDSTVKRRAASARLVALLDPIFASKPWEWWRAQCDAAGIPIGLIGRLQDLAADQQARASGAVVPSLSEGMPETLAVPFQLDRVSLGPRARAPALGEHANAILQEAGYSDDQIAVLQAQGVFGEFVAASGLTDTSRVAVAADHPDAKAG